MITPYVYFIKNNFTGQFYIGSRNQNVAFNRRPEDDFWKVYFTSSIFVNELIQKYGIDSFEVKIIFKYNDKDVCYWYEQLLIRESRKDVLSLNFSYNDPDTSKKIFNGKPHTDVTKQKLHDAHIGRKFSEEHRENIAKAKTGKKRQPHSEETKKKIGDKHRGKIQPADAVEKTAIKNRGRKWPLGSRKPRRPMSDLTKLQMKESQIKRRERERKNNEDIKLIIEMNEDEIIEKRG
jgi:group I intron endonuclease